MDVRVFRGLLLITKIAGPEHIYNEIDKIAQPGCFVFHSLSVWRIFLLSSLKWKKTKLLPLNYGLTHLSGVGSLLSESSAGAGQSAPKARTAFSIPQL